MTASASAERVGLGAALALGAEIWDGAMTERGVSLPFMSWAWHDAWAHAVSAAELERASVVLMRDAVGAVRSVIPLGVQPLSFRRVRVNALTWTAGDTAAPDHLSVPVMASELELLFSALDAASWHMLRLTGVDETAASTAMFCDAASARGFHVRRGQSWACPYLDLPGDWEELLRMWSPTRRQTVRRRERNLYRDFSCQLRDYDATNLDAGLRTLVDLHAKRWEGGGVFSDDRVRRLHGRFAQRLADRNALWLSALELDGVAVAAWYGFHWGDTVYFYQSGRDPAFERHSVGRVLMSAMIRRAIERGFKRFDFLRGDEAYKAQWTDTRVLCHEWLAFRPTPVGHALRGLDWVARQAWRFRTASAPSSAPDVPPSDRSPHP